VQLICAYLTLGVGLVRVSSVIDGQQGEPTHVRPLYGFASDYGDGLTALKPPRSNLAATSRIAAWLEIAV
jgi:hypothetical protein